MELNLHANATTTPKERGYIQRSKKPVAELAVELGVSETTIRRWRDRTTVADRSHTPKTLTSSLSAMEEAFNLMVEHAASAGANAVIAMRYDANEIADGITEVLAYGTAVVVEKA